jgi:peptidoglycan hydrolase CwlO-like protein
MTIQQFTPDQATGLPQLSEEQLTAVMKAIVNHFGFTWKHWQVEAQVIWNVLSSMSPNGKDMQIAALLTKLQERDEKVKELRRELKENLSQLNDTALANVKLQELIKDYKSELEHLQNFVDRL